MGKKIFLVGFMGAGKSTIAKLLATRMNLPLKDTDSIIENKAELSITRIFEQHGETFFRYLEGVVLHEILNESEPAVISTGGGLPCFENRMEWMNRADLTVYLKCRPEVLLERINRTANDRPLMSPMTEKEKIGFIREKLEERKPIYENARIVVNAESAPDNVVDEILYLIKQQEVE